MEQKLGRGLAALLGDDMEEAPPQRTTLVDINLILPNEAQPRKFFDDKGIAELTSSIKLHGIIQPIAVRPKGNNYEIVAGERRWRAARAAGLTEIPIHVIDCEDTTILALALVENIQRADLNPIEEAEAMRSLMTECECRQEDLSIIICKSRSYISNAMRLLTLPTNVQDLIRSGRLSAGHGRALIGVGNADEISKLVVENGWNVRQLEGAIKDLRAGGPIQVQEVCPRSPDQSLGYTKFEEVEDQDAKDLANRISSALKVKTQLKITKKGGILTLFCGSCEELESLATRLISLEELE